MYVHFNISKTQGKVRLISAPDARLKALQKKIARLLSVLYHPRYPVHGFVHDRSVKTNAESHIQRKYLLNLDLRDFFPTITERRVSGLLESIGLTDRVASLIARICCTGGCLPQGAPSSPVLSNMICFRLDKSLMNFAKKNRLLYTRYADDISFSSYQPLLGVFEGGKHGTGKILIDEISEELRAIVNRNGFSLHPDKIHYADKYSRRMVTGLKINEGMNVDRRYVRNVRALLYKVEKFGPAIVENELQARLKKKCSLQMHLQGKISWVGFTKEKSDPVFRGLAERYNKCFPAKKIKLQPTPQERLTRSVWVLETDTSTGSVFFLNGVGLVTAAHCVIDAKTLEVFHPSRISIRHPVTIVQLSKDRDLAILSHSIPNTEYFELFQSSGSIDVGERTVAAGFPGYGFGDRLNERPGTISSFAVQHSLRLIEVTQKLSQGMSGGPLMKEDLSVIGIIHKGGPLEQRDFAVSIEELREWMAEFPGA